jgi:RNA recognition motif-containing protein
MKELGTGRSRGFGFVSYEERVAAATAIKKMQGYKILGKRLKVEFKKGEGQDGVLDGTEIEADDAGSSSKKSYPDDERLIGYLRAISAKNVVQSLKESEGAEEDGDESGMPSGAPRPDDDMEVNDDD